MPPPLSASLCGACQRPIHDRYLLHVLDKAWHSECLRCADCKTPQDESCFYRDGLILCRNDFTRRFGVRCAGCKCPIERQELVRRARNRLYHVHCFCCHVCQKVLDTGEQLYVVDGDKFICKDDFGLGRTGKSNNGRSTNKAHRNEENGSDLEEENDEHSDDHAEVATVSNESNSGNEDSASRGDENHMGQKRRGPRTTIKAKQLETLKAAFATTPKPTRHIREQLAVETGLNMRVIQVWFQNRRSKERRMKQMRFNNNYRNIRRQRQDTQSAGQEDADRNANNLTEFMPLDIAHPVPEPAPYHPIPFAAAPAAPAAAGLLAMPAAPMFADMYAGAAANGTSLEELAGLDFLGAAGGTVLPIEPPPMFWAGAAGMDEFSKPTANV